MATKAEIETRQQEMLTRMFSGINPNDGKRDYAASWGQMKTEFDFVSQSYLVLLDWISFVAIGYKENAEVAEYARHVNACFAVCQHLRENKGGEIAAHLLRGTLFVALSTVYYHATDDNNEPKRQELVDELGLLLNAYDKWLNKE